MWAEHPSVDPRPVLRAYIDGRVVHFSASLVAGKQVVAGGSGAFELERAPVDCSVLGLQAQGDSGAVYIAPGTRTRR
jgi:hypothetical protein